MDDFWLVLRLEKRSVTAITSLHGDRYVVLFGGEVGESAKGHEGAGKFTNGVVVLDTATDEVVTELGAHKDSEEPPPVRGWLAGARTDDGRSMVVHGGLAGDDDAPKRLNDTWVMTLHPAAGKA